MRKAGIQFNPAVSLADDLTGIASTFSGQYRLEGSTGAWTPFPQGFVEEKPGFYSSPLTLTTPGSYLISIASTDSRVDDVDGYVTITAATVDDVQAAIAAAQLDITAMKAQVDTLDEATVNNIANQVTAVDTKLVELKGLLSDTDDAAVVSLRELLLDIQNAGSSRDSVITALTHFTDDLEAMVRGDEFLNDGVTANPFFGKTGHDIYDQLVDSTSFIHGAISDTKTALETDAHTTRDLIVGKVDAIKAVVDANSGTLENATYGLAAIKALLDNINSNTAGGTQSIIDMLNDAENGLAAIKTSIMDKLTTIEGKVDGIATAQSNYTRARVVL